MEAGGLFVFNHPAKKNRKKENKNKTIAAGEPVKGLYCSEFVHDS